MHRKHTAHVFRDLPDPIYRMLSQVSSVRSRIDGEIAAMKVREQPPASGIEGQASMAVRPKVESDRSF